MNKDFQENYLNDFSKMRGALLSQIANNSKLSEELMKQFSENDFGLLEEHAMLSKITLDSTKALSDAYKQAPVILNDIQNQKETIKIDLDELMKD